MRIISFGDLYIDYYLNNDLVLGICGGKTNANIVANLLPKRSVPNGNNCSGSCESYVKRGSQLLSVKII